MTMNELMEKVLEIMPNALFGEGDDGEVVIATGLALDGYSNDELAEIGE